MSIVGNAVGFVVIGSDVGTEEIDDLNDGRSVGVEVGTYKYVGTYEYVGAFEYVGDAVGVCLVGLGVGTEEIEGLNDGRPVGIGVVGVEALDDVGECVGMACVQS